MDADASIFLFFSFLFAYLRFYSSSQESKLVPSSRSKL